MSKYMSMHCLIVLYIRVSIAEMKIWLDVLFLNKILKQEYYKISLCNLWSENLKQSLLLDFSKGEIC